MDKSSSIASTNCPATSYGQSVTLSAVTPAEFKKAFVGSTRQIRESLGWDRKRMADEMGVPLERWIKYETRTPLPHHLLPLFCRVTGADLPSLFAGKATSGLPAGPNVDEGRLLEVLEVVHEQFPPGLLTTKKLTKLIHDLYVAMPGDGQLPYATVVSICRPFKGKSGVTHGRVATEKSAQADSRRRFKGR